MTGPGEVALFVDFENIRYGLRRFNQEPVIPQLMEKARGYGTVAVALAYADFSEHPEWVRRQMDIAGISARDVPLRRSFNNGIERVKSTADLHMVMDIMETVLDRPNVHTYLLMAGDSDYIRVTTWLRNRFDKRVVISGCRAASARTWSPPGWRIRLTAAGNGGGRAGSCGRVVNQHGPPPGAASRFLDRAPDSGLGPRST